MEEYQKDFIKANYWFILVWSLLGIVCLTISFFGGSKWFIILESFIAGFCLGNILRGFEIIRKARFQIKIDKVTIRVMDLMRENINSLEEALDNVMSRIMKPKPKKQRKTKK